MAFASPRLDHSNDFIAPLPPPQRRAPADSLHRRLLADPTGRDDADDCASVASSSATEVHFKCRDGCGVSLSHVSDERRLEHLCVGARQLGDAFRPFRQSCRSSPSPVKCPICERGISHLDATRRQGHVNDCLERQTDAQQRDKAQTRWQNTVDCPLCGEPQPAGPQRAAHAKSCARQNGLSSASSLLDLINVQQQVAANRKKRGLPHTSAAAPKPTVKKAKPDKEYPKTASDERVQLAKALSASTVAAKASASIGNDLTTAPPVPTASKNEVVEIVSARLPSPVDTAARQVEAFHPVALGMLTPTARWSDATEAFKDEVRALARRAADALPQMAELRQLTQSWRDALDSAAGTDLFVSVANDGDDCCPTTIGLHSSVLAVRCPLLLEASRGGRVCTTTRTLQELRGSADSVVSPDCLEGYNESAVRKLFEYIYCGTMTNVDSADLPQIQVLLEKFDLKPLGHLRRLLGQEDEPRPSSSLVDEMADLESDHFFYAGEMLRTPAAVMLCARTPVVVVEERVESTSPDLFSDDGCLLGGAVSPAALPPIAVCAVASPSVRSRASPVRPTAAELTALRRDVQLDSPDRRAVNETAAGALDITAPSPAFDDVAPVAASTPLLPLDSTPLAVCNGDGALAVTPMPNFSDMNTPAIKLELKKYGVRPTLGKKRAVKLLKDVYDCRHDAAAPVAAAKEINGADGGGGESDVAEESCLFLGEDAPEQPAQIRSHLRSLLRSKAELHHLMLLGKPISFDHLYQLIEQSDVQRCSKRFLVDFLDSEAIPFSVENDRWKARRKQAK